MRVGKNKEGFWIKTEEKMGETYTKIKKNMVEKIMKKLVWDKFP